jgi:glycosyltransferase involved in cell wall biosynthesis
LSDVIVVPTNSGANALTGEIGVPSSKVSVIPLGVEVESVKHLRVESRRELGLEGRSVVLLFGSYRKQKGFLELMDIAPGIIRSRPSTIFLLVGGVKRGDAQSSQYRARVLEAIGRLGVSKHVILKDFPDSRETTRRIFASADLCVFPYETGPQHSSLALAQALGFGLPVIATDFACAPEMLSENRGLVVGHHDELELAILRLLSDEQLREMYSANAFRYAQRMLSWSAVTDAHSSLYESLL